MNTRQIRIMSNWHILGAFLFFVITNNAHSQLSLYSKHPRLIFRDQNWNGGYSIDILKIRASLSEYRGIGDEVQNRFGALGQAMAFVLTGNSKYAEEAIAQLLSSNYSEVQTGDEQPPLSVFQNTIAYDWVYAYNGFSFQDKERIEAGLADVAMLLASSLDGYGPSLYHRRTSIASALAVIVLALEHDPRKDYLFQKAIEHYRGVTVKAIDYAEGWPEGFTYWALNRAIRNAIAALCWKSAVVGDNLFSESTSQSDYLKKIAYWHIYGLRPDNTFVRYSDVSLQLDLKFEYRPFLDILAQLYQDLIIANFVDYIHNQIGNRDYYSSDEYMFSFLFGYDYSIPKAPISDLPLTVIFGRDSWGQVFMRESWEPNATYITFKAGDYLTHHQGYDQGAFTIYKYTPLAINAGSYGDFGSPHREGYWIRSISRNTILIYDPDEQMHFGINDGGQRVINSSTGDIQSIEHWQERAESGPHYETANITQFKSQQGKYDYILADITKAYNSTYYDANGQYGKVSLVTRQFTYLRPNYIVIFDKVHATESNYQKKWILHSVGKPITENENVITGSARAGILESNDSLVVITNDQGRLFVKILCPKEHIITKIGGSNGEPYGADDYEFYVDGANRFQGMRNKSIYDLGKWRIEVSSQNYHKFDQFLHVFYPTDANTDSMPETDLIKSIKGKSMCGAYIKDKLIPYLVLFAVNVEEDISQFSYSITNNKTVRHLICDLPTNTFCLLKKNGIFLDSFSVDMSGTFYFEDNPQGNAEYELEAKRYIPNTPQSFCFNNQINN